MENQNNIDVILLSKDVISKSCKQELIKWLTTTAQTMIGRQRKTAKKLFLLTLRDTPAIYLS